MLFVLGSEAAVRGAAVLDLAAEFQRYGARLVEFDRVHLHLGVGADDADELAVGWAPFAHQDLVFFDDDLRINHRFALGTDAAGQFMENVVGVLFDPDLAFVSGFDQVASFYLWLTKR